MQRLIIVFICLFFITGCIKKDVHQGNVMDPDSIWIIQKGDTRFAIESEMGTPMIQDAKHPERALYIEYVEDEEADEKYTRGVEVTYDKAWRATNIRRFGFE